MAEDIVFNITGDSSSAQQAVNDLISPLQQLQTQLETIGGLLSIFDEMQTAVQDVSASMRGLLDAITPVATAIEDIATAIDGITGSADTFSKALSVLDAANTTTQTNVDNTTASIDTLDASLTNVGTSSKDALTQLTLFDEATLNALNSVDATTKSLDTLTVAADNAATATANLTTAQDALATSTDTNTASDEVEVTDIDALNATLDTTATTMDAVAASTDTTSRGALLLADALATLQGISLALTGDMDTFTNAFGAAAGTFSNFATGVQAATASVAQYVTTATAASQAAADLAAEEAAANDAFAVNNGIFSANAINLIILATAVTSVGGAFLKMGTAAQDALAKVVGLADQSLALSSNQKVLDGYIQQLSLDAEKYGVSLADATNGLYYIISAGFQTADAMKVLSVSMEAASATQTDMQTVSLALTSVLKAYNLSADQSTQVMDKMIAAVNAGRQDFQQFANVIGPVAVAGERLGLSFDQVAAAEATLTMINQRTRQDAQNLASLFQTLHDKQSDIVGSAQALGGTWTENQFAAASLIDKLQYLAKVAGGDTTQAFDGLLQNATAAKTAFYLLTDGGNSYLSILAKIDASQGDLTVAFQVWENTISASVDKIKAALSVIAYQFTVIATPITKTILDAISTALQSIANNAQILSPILIGLGTFMVTVLIGALIAVIGYLGGLSTPILLVATGFSLLSIAVSGIGMAFSQFGASIVQAFPALNGLQFTLQEIADYISNKWNEALQFAQKAWNEFVQGLQKNDFFTNIQKMVNNIIEFANIIAQQAIPNMQKLVNGPLKDFGNWLINTGIPQLDKFLGEMAKLGAQNTSSDKLIKFFGDIGKAIQDMMPWLAGFLAAVGTFAAFVAPWGTIIANIVGWIGRLAAGIFGANSALAPLIAFLGALDPIAVVIIALFAILVGIFVGMTTQSKELQKEWGSLGVAWDGVKKALAEGAKTIADAWNGAMVPALKKLWEAIQPLIPALKLVAEAFGGGLIGAIGILISLLAGAITVVANFVAGLIKLVAGLTALPIDALHMFIDLFKALMDSMMQNKDAAKDWAKVWDDVKKIVGDAWTAIQGLWQMTFGGLLAGVKTFTDTVTAFFQNLANVLVLHSIIPDMLDKIVQLFQQFPSRIVQVLQKWVSDVVQWFQQLADKVQKTWAAGWNALVMIVQNVSQSVSQTVSSWVNNIVQFFGDLGDKIQKAANMAWMALVTIIEQKLHDAEQAVTTGLQAIAKPFEKLISDAQKWGSDMIAGFIQGIQSAMPGIGEAVQGIASGIKAVLGFSVPETGPLADADKWMPDFGNLLTSGLNDQTKKVALAARNIAMSISASAPDGSAYANIAAGGSSSSEQTQVLKAILAELQRGNGQGATVATIGYPAVSTSLGAINQQFNTYNNGNNAQTYNTYNTLAGLSQEYSRRGSVNGLGF